MKLSDWASIAEIIAAVGVILSLIFVGLQINEGNQETRAATVQAAADGEAFVIATTLNHAGLWQKVITGAPLDRGEETRGAGTPSNQRSSPCPSLSVSLPLRSPKTVPTDH